MTGPIVAVGECMLELRRDGDAWRLGHGGDTFNTVLSLARLGEPTAYLTALGDDPFSRTMLGEWYDEGLDTELVLIAPGRLPGLYAIELDDAGERSFHYWREAAPVRDLFRLAGCGEVLAKAGRAALLYLSGITLALFDEAGRAALGDLAGTVRAGGGAVAFDPNYRARMWPSPAAARDAIAAFAPMVTLALPTFDDEAALHGDATPEATLDRRRASGAEVVVKIGAGGCMLDDRRIVAPTASIRPVDTTGAGDAFNAGYIAMRRRGADKAAAAAFGNLLAGRTIAHPGAILPRSAMPDMPCGD